MNPPPRTGRPPIDEPRSETIQLRVTKREREMVEQAAAKVGNPQLTVYAREKALEGARRDLES